MICLPMGDKNDLGCPWASRFDFDHYIFKKHSLGDGK